MDASSTRRARLTRLALCTAAVLAVAAFTGEARAESGLPALVSGTVSTTERLPSPAAEPLAGVVSTVAPTADTAVPPVVDEVAADATQLPGEVAGPASAGIGPNGNAGLAETPPRATSTPEAAPSVGPPAPLAVEAPSPAPTAPTYAAEASRPRTDLTPRTKTVAPAPRPSVRSSSAPLAQAAISRADFAPSGLPATSAVADSHPDTAPQAPSSPLPARSELPGFDALLPPLAAFALLLALPLGLFALTAPSELGAGLQPAVALLRSADVRFRLVRPG